MPTLAEAVRAFIEAVHKGDVKFVPSDAVSTHMTLMALALAKEERKAKETQ